MTVADARSGAGRLPFGCEGAIIYDAIPGTFSRRTASISEHHRSCNTIFLWQMNLPLGARGGHALPVLLADAKLAANTPQERSGQNATLGAQATRLCSLRLFADAKLTENGVENLFHTHDANYLADCAQRLIKINSYVFHRQTFAQSQPCAIA
jgi:hypothetical protein